jgi:hypothetical protein
MAIVLKYGSPGPILNAGFASGVGRRKDKQQEDLLKIWQQQQQAQQAAIDRNQRAALQQNALNFQADQQADNLAFQIEGRAFQAGQNKLDREFRAGEAGRARGDRFFEGELDRQQQQLLLKNRDEDLRIRSTEQGLQKGELELPEPARRKLNQLEEGLVAAMELDPVQQQEFREKYEKQKRDLLSFARPVAKMSPEEEFQKSTFEKDGTTYQRTDKGFDVLKDGQAEQQKQQEKLQAEQQKRQQELVSDAKKLMSEKDDEDNPKYKSFGEALQKADAMRREADAFFTPPASQQTQPNGTFSGLPAVTEPQQAAPPQQGGVTRGRWPYTPEAIQENLKKYPNLTPDVAKGVTPELVMTMADQGAQDPVKAAIVYQGLTKGGSLTSADKSQQTWYQPEERKEILEKSQLPKPQSEEEYNALPSGATYVYTDGTIRKKP